MLFSAGLAQKYRYIQETDCRPILYNFVTNGVERTQLVYVLVRPMMTPPYVT